MQRDVTTQAAERRRFYRIEDRLALTYRLLDEAEFGAAIERLASGVPDKLSLASDFASTTSQMRHTLERFRRDAPEIAAYLDALNAKVDMLASLLAASDDDLSQQAPRDVNLSASGVSFTTDEPMPSGSKIEVKTLLVPSHVSIVALGQVVHCGPAEAGRPSALYTVGIDFTHLRDGDRDLIVRHVMQRQAAMVREARLAVDDED